MKKSMVTNHERWIAAETKKQGQIALEALRVMVFKETVPIVAALIEKAKDGDYKTAELLFDRAFGKAKESLDVNVQFSLVRLAAQWEEQKKLSTGV